jgi:hypothetical protein
MPRHASESMNRREFVRACARYALLGGLAAGAASRLAGPGRRAAGACLRTGICPGCPRQDECDLPQALLARRHRERMRSAAEARE